MSDIEFIKEEINKMSHKLDRIENGEIKVNVTMYGRKPDNLDLSNVLQTLIDRPQETFKKAVGISDGLMKFMALLQFIVTVLIALGMFLGGK